MGESLVTGRIAGIDFGKRFVGVAVSDPLFLTATPLCTIERKRPDKFRSTLSKFLSIKEEYGVSAFVLGLPKNLDGTENERCEFTREFAELLFNKVKSPVYLWDERLSTVSADKELSFLGKKDKKKYNDELAAVYILEGFLAAKNNGIFLHPYLQ